MVAVTASMMVRIPLVGVTLHLVRIAFAMVERCGRGGFHARHSLGRVRDRPEPERQHKHEAEEEGGEPVHSLGL